MFLPTKTKKIHQPKIEIEKKINLVHQNIPDVKIKEIANRIIEGELIAHEYDRNILRSILWYFINSRI